MPLNVKIQVDTPKHCVKVSKGEHVYIQYSLKTYRNENGKPTSKMVAICKLDKETGKLIPNCNYCEIFEKSSDAVVQDYLAVM